jgi:hypothetical protein
MDGTCLMNYKKESEVRRWNPKKEPQLELKCDLPICGDVHIVFYDKDKLGKDDKMFGFWLNTSFIKSSSLILGKSQLDKAVKDKNCKHFPKDFQVEVTFSGITSHRIILHFLRFEYTIV